MNYKMYNNIFRYGLKRAKLREGAIPENIILSLGVNNSFIAATTQEWNNTPLTKKRKVQYFEILKKKNI